MDSTARVITAPKCDQCEQLRINGVVCHELGCPNMGRKWDADREAWIKYVDCFVCGCPVEVGTACDCEDPAEDDDYEDDDYEEEIG